jgi:hypothetical protein
MMRGSGGGVRPCLTLGASGSRGGFGGKDGGAARGSLEAGGRTRGGVEWW